MKKREIIELLTQQELEEDPAIILRDNEGERRVIIRPIKKYTWADRMWWSYFFKLPNHQKSRGQIK